MTDNSFFNESRGQSQVKSAIVAKYFDAWAKVMISTQKRYPRGTDERIAYIDLFAGPGRFKDGTKSTPVLVLEKAIQDSDLRRRLVTIFNDKDEDNSQSLTTAIQSIPGIETMKHKPQVTGRKVGE